MNPKISKLKAERAKNDGKIAMLQSRNREIDEDIIKLENEDIVGLARATTSEPKTDDTDEVLNAGLRLLAQPDVPEEKLQRMLTIVRTEKHRVAPNCATCAMPCGNTTDYDLTRLWNAPQAVRTLKLRMLAAAIRLAQQHPSGDRQTAVYQVLFTLAEDWDESLLPWLSRPARRFRLR